MRPSERAIDESLKVIGELPEDAPDIFQRVATIENVQREAQAQAARMAEDFRTTFNGPAGERVLGHLRRQFVDCPLFDPDPNVMVNRVAKHDLVLQIIETVETKSEAIENDG